MCEWASFPRTRFVYEAKASQQFRHLKSEVKEVEEAFWSSSVDDVVKELFDVIHSAETLLRMFEEKHGIDVGQLKDKVIQKNRERGYYD